MHHAFAPTQEEVTQLRRVLEAFEAANALGDGVIALNGQMVHAPIVDRARELVLLAEDLPARE